MIDESLIVRTTAIDALDADSREVALRHRRHAVADALRDRALAAAERLHVHLTAAFAEIDELDAIAAIAQQQFQLRTTFDGRNVLRPEVSHDGRRGPFLQAAGFWSEAFAASRRDKWAKLLAKVRERAGR